MYDDNNVFAKILKGDIPCDKIYEDEYVLSFYDVKPQKKIHALIIPKGKYVDLDDFNSKASDKEIVGLVKGISIVAKKLLKFGYNIQGFKNSSTSAKYPFSVYFKDKDLIKFIKSSDVIVSILPATTKTKNLIDKNFLNRMKKKSFLINVGRGNTVNEKDLLSHLKKNRYFKASLDVFKKEPLNEKHKFWKI